jgi:GNAT superfamily N-acetyltransferase
VSGALAVPTIREAQSAADYAAFGDICRAYVAWFRGRYRDVPGFANAVFGHQSIEAELQGLPYKYGPPHGRTLLAETAGTVVAAGAYRRLDGDICELKRLYVTEAARGLGLGRRLSDALIAAATADGYRIMRLDTGALLTEAIGMYEAMGFIRIAPYHDYSSDLLPHLLFMERRL